MRYKTARSLEMAVKQAARDSPLDTGRAIEGFYRHRFLCRVFSDPGSPFVLKGGQSVLARTVDARNSRDVDLSSNAAALGESVDSLMRLAAMDLDDHVSFDLAGQVSIRVEDERKSGVRLFFDVFLGGRKKQRLTVDLVVDLIPAEVFEVVRPVDRLEVSGIAVCDYRMQPVSYALVDKFFGIMELHGGRVSSRVKDLADVVLYLSHCRIDEVQFRHRFDIEREAHRCDAAEFSVPPSWFDDYSAVYAKVASDAHVEKAFPSLSAAEAVAKSFYDAVLRGEVSGCVWNPERLCWE